MVVGHAQIETHTWPLQKMLDLFGIPHFGAPQAPRNKFSSTKQVLPKSPQRPRKHPPDTNIR